MSSVSSVRVSMHNARTRADGSVFNVRHNDRTHKSGSVVSDSSLNRYYIINDAGASERVSGGLYEYELSVYDKLFSASLEAQNARYKAHGNNSRVKSVEDVYRNARTCPEEIYLAIGKMGEDVSFKDLMSCVGMYIQLCQKCYPQMRFLDVACHRDESGQVHAHLRRTYVAHGDDGDYVSERAALEQMDIPLLYPDRAPSRVNTRKARITSDMRDMWVACCESAGFSVISEPAHPGKMTMTREQYVVDKLRQEKKQLIERIDAAQNALNALSSRLLNDYGLDISDAVSCELEALDSSLRGLSEDLDTALS